MHQRISATSARNSINQFRLHLSLKGTSDCFNQTLDSSTQKIEEIKQPSISRIDFFARSLYQKPSFENNRGYRTIDPKKYFANRIRQNQAYSRMNTERNSETNDKIQIKSKSKQKVVYLRQRKLKKAIKESVSEKITQLEIYKKIIDARPQTANPPIVSHPETLKQMKLRRKVYTKLEQIPQIKLKKKSSTISPWEIL